MTDACCYQLFKVTLDHKSAPVTQHSVAVDHRVQQLSIGPLVHHPVLQISNIDCLKEHRGDPGLKQEPASKIDSSDYSISTSLKVKYVVPPVLSHFVLLYRFVFLLKILISDNKKLYILSNSLFCCSPVETFVI